MFNPLKIHAIMKKEYLAVKAFVYFSFNYHSVDGFIDYICDKTNKKHLKTHLREKFDYLYEIYDSCAVMQRFFAELDTDLRCALVDYACKVYYPQGFPSDEEGIALLTE